MERERITMALNFEITAKRIILRDDVKELSWVEYEEEDGTIHLIKTFTDREYRGRGYASQVVEKALEFADSYSRIKVSCPYIKSWIEEHGYKREVEFVDT
ncbi:MAG: GNAT family N-acetyltransferase [Candidatus Hadarchaeota archaeon]